MYLLYIHCTFAKQLPLTNIEKKCFDLVQLRYDLLAKNPTMVLPKTHALL